MTTFWMLAALMIIVAAAFVLVPVLVYRRRNMADGNQDGMLDAANAAVYKSKLQELEAELAEGRLTKGAFEEQKLELINRLEEELGTEADSGTATVRPGGLALPLVLVAILPVFAFVLYQQWGAYDAMVFQQKMEDPESRQNLPELLSDLETVLETRPDNVQGWYMLAHGYLSEQRYEDAAAAFSEVLKRNNEDPEIMSQYAQAKLLANDNKMTPEVAAMVERALALDPDNRTALGMHGIAVFEKGEYREAVRVWQALLNGTISESGRQALIAGIEQAKQRLAEQGENVDDLPSINNAGQQITGKGIQIQVTLGQNLQSLPPETRIYLFARAAGGSKMPLAIIPLTVSQLPTSVELNDSHAMMDGMKLSDFEQFDIVARVSLTGDVMNADYETVLNGYSKGSDTPAQLVIEG